MAGIDQGRLRIERGVPYRIEDRRIEEFRCSGTGGESMVHGRTRI
jgi:hypothetical protein